MNTFDQANFLCQLSDLDATGSKGVSIQHDGKPVDLFVVKNEEGVFCYLDSCPHTGSPLAWKEDVFLDEEGKYIMCANHGALFQIDDGYCISGPCRRQYLQSLPIEIVDDAIFLQV